MCGIFTAVDFSGALPTEASCRHALDLMRHRGPDRAGLVGSDLCIVGATRLSITGSTQSAQPLRLGHFTVALNGEIYNFEALRSKLQADGVTFYGNGDTEVAARAFMRWGNSAFDLFDGMFALIAWNAESQTLTLARDHFGEKSQWQTPNSEKTHWFMRVTAFRILPVLPRLFRLVMESFLWRCKCLELVGWSGQRPR